MRLKTVLFTAALALGVTASADAATITCPTPLGSFERQITMTNVSECQFAGPVTGTPDATDVGNRFNPDPWTNEGGVTGNGTNDWLTVNLTSGSWGQANVSGNWSVNPLFWQQPNGYGSGVITFHLGNGNGDPDWFFFKLDTGALNGTFTITNIGEGGGLSNMNLWGAGEGLPPCTTPICEPPLVTPEPGTMLMLGTGLALLAARLRRRKA